MSPRPRATSPSPSSDAPETDAPTHPAAGAQVGSRTDAPTDHPTGATKPAPRHAGSTVAAPEPGRAMPRPTRDLLALRGMGTAELKELLARSRAMIPAAMGRTDLSHILKGRAVGLLFFEDSTRTRLSFTMAAQRLGATTLDLASGGSSVSKGETLIDTALNVEAIGAAALVVRAKQSGAAHQIAQPAKIPVLNGGDGKHEHPTQALLDALTIAESLGRSAAFDLTGLSIAIVGDVISSRVARSNIAALSALGAQVIVVGPPTLAPKSMSTLGCKVEHDLDNVLPTVDAVMMLRVQFERHGGEGSSGASGGASHAAAPAKPPITPSSIVSVRAYREGYALTSARAAMLKPHAVVLHPGPINRGIEMDQDVADGPRSAVLRQVTHGVAVRMASLCWCLGIPA
ncbi:MAG: aspartate carbamoyltransferase [Phycisphaeraceae bacterium]|nr:aspartate carbamoyltransferase [Phycisphaeraceae bacterium]